MKTSTRNGIVLVILALVVLPFAYNRPTDLLKMWLGVLTVAQLFSIYAIKQMSPSEAHEDMLVTQNTSMFGGDPEKEKMQLRVGQQMGAKGNGTLINEKKYGQEVGVQGDLTAILQA